MFRYTVDFPLNGKAAPYILRNLSGGNSKLAAKKFLHLGIGSATFGKQYASLDHNYELNFDHDMGFLKFNIDLKDKIGAIMDQITDIVGAQRGEYTIMDNETDEEVCLDALNDKYPSSSNKNKSFRYSVRLYPNNVYSIQEAIYAAHPNIVLTDCEQEYECEQFTIDIDSLSEQKSICFYFNQTKLDINYVNSIIYPVMKALNYKKFDYVVNDNRTGEEIECEGDFIDEDPEHGFESDSEQDDESTCSSYCSSFEFHQAVAKKQDDDEVSNCSSYEFGQPTADEAEEWLNEMTNPVMIIAVTSKSKPNYAAMCESDAEDDSDDEWLPPAEQRAKERKIASAKKREEKKALKEEVDRIIQEQKEAKKAEKALKKANMTEEEKAAYAAKVEAIIADRRAKKAARLQAEVKKEEELHKAAYNEMYALEEVTARQEAKEELEKKERLFKKLQRLDRQLN
jgi:hypothetical protein